MCHYCGSQMEPPTVCPACGGKLQYRGFGTQKAEEELAKLFPDARVLRMDQDSTCLLYTSVANRAAGQEGKTPAEEEQTHGER